MADDHGNCCCDHTDARGPNHDHGEREQAAQPRSANTSSSCYGGGADRAEITLSSPRTAEQPAHELHAS